MERETESQADEFEPSWNSTTFSLSEIPFTKEKKVN